MREEPEEGLWLTANWYQVRDDWRADAAVIGACYREHVGPPSKPLKSQTGDLQCALGRAEVPGVPDELARLLAQEKEEGAEEGTRKAREDRGDVDEEVWQLPRGGAKGHAGLFRLVVPRRVQVGDVGRGNENRVEATSESRETKFSLSPRPISRSRAAMEPSPYSGLGAKAISSISVGFSDARGLGFLSTRARAR